jgi:hypothetical protein
MNHRCIDSKVNLFKDRTSLDALYPSLIQLIRYIESIQAADQERRPLVPLALDASYRLPQRNAQWNEALLVTHNLIHGGTLTPGATPVIRSHKRLKNNFASALSISIFLQHIYRIMQKLTIRK